MEVIDAAQEKTQQLHLDMEAEFDGLRAIVSQHMTAISGAVLPALLEAIEEVTEQRTKCQSVNSPVVPQFERLGSQLSQCALYSDLRIQSLTSAFYDILAGPQSESIALLSTVLDHVGHSNPVDTPTQVGDDIDQSLGELRLRFENEMVPALREEVDHIQGGIASVPQITRDCVNVVLEQANTLAVDC